MTSEIVLSQTEKEALLSERELREYRIFMRLKQPPMAQSTQLQLFQLFLQHNSCEMIHKLNPSGFSLGAIVRARIENDWDAHAQAHRNDLMARVRNKVAQVHMETLERLANELAASNKLASDAALKFIATGDPAELKGTSIGSVRHLRETIDLLQKLTGQDQSKKSVEIHHTVSTQVANEKVVQAVVIPADKPLGSQTAANALEAIYKSRQKQ